MLIPTEIVPGTLVGPWLLQERLDWGNYGVVFRAQRAGHPESPPVALKMARHPRDARFEREVQSLQRMQHPNIPRYEDSGLWTSPGGHRHPYVVMELVEGFTLYDWFGERQRSSRQVLAVLSQMASALAAAHALGVLHRDVKGDNIRVTAAGRAVLVDWGSSWFAGARPLTDTTAPPGTTAYRPPEQRIFMWRFQKDLEARWYAQPSDDLYALGVTVYRLVTGVYLPLLTDGGEPVERKVRRPSTLVTVSPELEALILRLIDDDRKARGTAEQLAREVEGLVQAPGPEADKPILPTASAMPTKESRELSDTAPARRGHFLQRESRLGACLSLACVVSAAGLLVFLGWEMHRTASEHRAAPTPWIAESDSKEVSRFAPDAGVADEGVASVHDVPQAVLPALVSLGRPMPTTPLRGQRRPPCPRGDREINGVCWVKVADETPPCGDTMFDYGNACYKASVDMPRQPTSEEP